MTSRFSPPSRRLTGRLAAVSLAFAILIISPLGANALSAQVAVSAPVSSSSRMATRTQLDAAAAQFEQFAASSAYSERTRARARVEATTIRRRISDGDFRVGDRIAVRIDGSPGLTDTVTVLDGRLITLAGYRQVSLAGVLHAELEAKLRLDLADYIVNTTVTARPLLRVAVFGNVGRPGYLSVPGETSIDQLVSLAGGPTSTADMQKLKVVRGEEVMLEPAEVLEAVAEGQTLDGLGFVDGDALVVPLGSPPLDRNGRLQIVGLFLTPLITIFLVR
ncbi:MAG: SLBB domain-containing protein [Gemmatimonadaceae bacterium]|nr:SLBB domain-containing protein [Gemmatimonadaceae bacterium]